MSTNKLLAFTAINIGLFGLLSFLVPGVLGAIFDLNPVLEGQYVQRYFGSSVLGFATILWVCRDVPPSRFRKGLLLGSIVALGTGLPVTIVGTLAGHVNSWMWLIALNYAGLLAAYVYAYQNEPTTDV